MLLIFFCLPGWLLFGYHWAYWQKIYPGVKVVGLSLANLAPKQAANLIEQNLLPTNSLSLTLKDANQTWVLVLDDFDFHYLPEVTAQKAFALGRSQNPWADLKLKAKNWFTPQELAVAFQIDWEKFDQQVATIAAEVFVPTIEPAIKIENPGTPSARILVEPGQAGQELDQEKLKTAFAFQLGRLDFSQIPLPLFYPAPHLSETQAKIVQQRAEKFLGKKIVCQTQDQEWTLGEEELVNFLDLTQGFDQEKIASFAAQLAQTINRLPQNAAFSFQAGRVVQFRPAWDGQTLDQEKTNQVFGQALNDLAQDKKEITLKLPLFFTPPQITTAEVNTLGIQELLGQGISFFHGSIASRIHNLTLASSKLNGLLIPPGEIFSFNQSLGDVSEATGFKPAYIIKEGRTVLGDGGGVCQVSTTLFRAALNAGLPIVERKAHAYRVAYYEQGSPPGLDATVFDPTADLKFQNDTHAHLLIQSAVDLKNFRLAFSLYGTNDNRQATVSSPRIWDQVPPPPDLYQDDPTLPAGTSKQIDWKAWGAKVAFDYQVARGAEILQDRTFYSVYRPWQAVFLRGPSLNQ